MIRLNHDNIELKAGTITYLSNKQSEIDEINAETHFPDKSKKAIDSWKNKDSNNQAFTVIKGHLIDMAVGYNVCVYCEHNTATDIEHIYPKKLYPERTYLWSNYVLACNVCNTHNKSDNFKIFSTENPNISIDVTCPRGEYLQPENDDGLFIDQRSEEDPMDFLILNFSRKPFLFDKVHAPGSREYQKAEFTINILGLNLRADLSKARTDAFYSFFLNLQKYVNVKNATTHDELRLGIDDDIEAVDLNRNLDLEKGRIMESIKNSILKHHHPTVWKEMIRQRGILPKTNTLLNSAPEALNWM